MAITSAAAGTAARSRVRTRLFYRPRSGCWCLWPSGTRPYTPRMPAPIATGRRRPARAACLAVSALAFGTVVLVGCGGSDQTDTTTSTTRASGSALSERDAEQLSRVLFENYQAGGAPVQIDADYSSELSVSLDGEVDWANHQGAFTVTSTFADGRPQESVDVIFTQDAVYTSPTPQEATLLAQRGFPGVQWIKRSPEIDSRPLDQVIELTVSLASTRPDNPQLVLQGDMEFDRQEQVEGRAANVFTSPKDGTYWIDEDSGRLVRFQGTLPGFAGPVVIDIDSARPTAVTLPAPATVVDASALAN
jgi:hypothetical protein